MQNQIEKTGATIKFTEPENLHFNLKFLGETPENEIDSIKGVLNNVSKHFEQFKVHIGGIGVFPSLNYIKVIWLGVTEGSHLLRSLAEAIDSGLSEKGFSKETRKFTPHLTLGRVRSKKNKEELVSMLKSLEKTDIGNMVLQEISLIESVLGKTGPAYKKLHIVKLKPSP